MSVLVFPLDIAAVLGQVMVLIADIEAAWPELVALLGTESPGA